MRGRSLFRPALALTLIGALGAWSASASDKLESCDLSLVTRTAHDLAARHGGPEKVLLVFDLDNTLLKSSTSLGSDQWFSWQAGLIEAASREGAGPYLAARDFPGLLRAQTVLFALGSMVPPDARGPAVVRNLQAEGFPAMVCTSRGPDTRDATLRELRRNGYDFTRTAPPGGGDLRIDPGPAGAPVSYAEGIFWTSGQNKGTMLRALWKGLGLEFKAVVLLDDSARNTDRVYGELDAQGCDVWVIRYAREDSVVSDFVANKDGLQDIVKAQWDKLRAVLREIWGLDFIPLPSP
jgi:hypothetical protein